MNSEGLPCIGTLLVLAFAVIVWIVADTRKMAREAEIKRKRQLNQDMANEYLAKKLIEEQTRERGETKDAVPLAQATQADPASSEDKPSRGTADGAWDDSPANSNPTYCPRCGALNLIEATECTRCGLRLRTAR